MKIRKILKKVFNSNVNLFKRMREQSRIHQRAQQMDVTNLYSEVHHDASPCFVLSTGRCGTKLLTQILNRNRDIKASHVPTPELTYYSAYAYQKALSDYETIKKL